MSEKYKSLNPEGIYLTTTTIINWIDLFTRKDYAELFWVLCGIARIKRDLSFTHGNLMPSHLHLITGSKEKFSLHEIFRNFNAPKFIRCTTVYIRTSPPLLGSCC